MTTKEEILKELNEKARITKEENLKELNEMTMRTKEEILKELNESDDFYDFYVQSQKIIIGLLLDIRSK